MNVINFIFKFCINQNRRSWTEDFKNSEGKPYESESGGNDSDASTEDHRLAGKYDLIGNV